MSPRSVPPRDTPPRRNAHAATVTTAKNPPTASHTIDRLWIAPCSHDEPSGCVAHADYTHPRLGTLPETKPRMSSYTAAFLRTYLQSKWEGRFLPIVNAF